VTRRATRSAPRRKAVTRRNPPLTVFALNAPKGVIVSDRLHTIEYFHKQKKKNYYHDFRPGTQMIALPSGDVLLHRPGGRVWEDLPG